MALEQGDQALADEAGGPEDGDGYVGRLHLFPPGFESLGDEASRAVRLIRGRSIRQRNKGL
jgi:hypothetical protein